MPTRRREVSRSLNIVSTSVVGSHRLPCVVISLKWDAQPRRPPQLIRGWFGRRLARRRGEDRRRRRREAMEAVWYVTVLGAMEKSIARFDKVCTGDVFYRGTQVEGLFSVYDRRFRAGARVTLPLCFA